MSDMPIEFCKNYFSHDEIFDLHFKSQISSLLQPNNITSNNLNLFQTFNDTSLLSSYRYEMRTIDMFYFPYF